MLLVQVNNMADDQIDGHPPQYGLTLEELRDLMEQRKHEAYETIQTKYNGVLEMCKKLYTSSNEGKEKRGDSQDMIFCIQYTLNGKEHPCPSSQLSNTFTRTQILVTRIDEICESGN